VCSPRSGMLLLSRSLRLELELLGGDDNGARRARAPLSRPVPRGRRRRCRRPAGGVQADRVIGVYFLRFRRKPMPPTRAAPDARSVSVAGYGTRTRGVAWALPGSMKRTASAIRAINSPGTCRSLLTRRARVRERPLANSVDSLYASTDALSRGRLRA